MTHDRWRAVPRGLMFLIEMLCSALLVLMVIFTAYTVIMRYVFNNPPFWGDTLTMFCNIWFVLLGYAASVRKRDYIAMQGFYAVIPHIAGFLLNLLWDVITMGFGAFLVWYGLDAAMRVPGQFWELGGLPKKIPLMIMPLSGGLFALAALFNVSSDIRKLRDGRIREPFADDMGEGI